MRRLVLSVPFLIALAGCGLGPTPPQEKTVQASAPIVNGSPDTTHKAVVALLGQQSECTGTIVQVKNGIGYVLTAAHCCTPQDPLQVLTMANDYNNGPYINIMAGSAVRDPAYNANNNTHDFCMLKFQGANAQTPVIPVVTAPDNLASGTIVDFIGYGVTGDPNNPANDNSLRLHKTGPINGVDSLLVYYNESNNGSNPINGGPCSGDSGGPAITTSGPVVVVAVTSAGDQTCSQFGISGRVTSATGANGFITQYLNDQVIMPAMDCNTCSQNTTSQGGACYNAALACFNDQACSNLNDCIGNCNGSQACVDGCVNQFQAGVAKLNAVYACICNTGCTTECAAECGSQPSCGLTASDPNCNTCLENSCCGEAQNCANNTTCTSCLVANPPASCNNNAQYNALLGCLDAKCGAQCGGSSSSSSSSGMASSSSGNASSSSGGQGGGGQGGGGQGNGGGATGSGGGNIGEEGGCSMSQSSSSGATPAFLAIALGAALSLLRRRRDARRA